MHLVLIDGSVNLIEIVEVNCRLCAVTSLTGWECSTLIKTDSWGGMVYS